jgi:acyl carrier protein
MSTADGNSTSEWLNFAERMAKLTDIPAEAITPDAKLMQGLGLDSLGLAELAVALQEAYESRDRPIDLEGRNWETITVGQLFKDLTGSPAPATA